VVALAVWGVTALLGRGDTPPPIPPETTSTVDPGPGTSVTGDGSESDSSGLAADAPQGSFLLAVAVAEGQSSWISVSIDSLVAYEGTMPGGESKEWTVTAVAVIRAGQPASVSVMRDGQPVELPAPVNGISEITLTAAAE
jgi:hypothetical protein